MKSQIFTLFAMVLLVGRVQAQTVIYEDSFDYGSSTVAISSVGAWNSISAVLKYDHDGGLTHAGLAGETGGAMWLDYTDSRSASHSFATAFDLTTLSQGDSVWIAVLFQFVSGNTAHVLDIAGGTVSDMGLTVNSSGSVSVKCTLNTTVNANNSTGLSVTNGTHLFLLRYTKGSGSSPIDSQVDLWINSADTSSEAALGAADWTLDSSDGQVKWGRDGNSLTSISSAQPSQQGRIDEIRIGTDFATVTGGVQPDPPAGTVLIIR